MSVICAWEEEEEPVGNVHRGLADVTSSPLKRTESPRSRGWDRGNQPVSPPDRCQLLLGHRRPWHPSPEDNRQASPTWLPLRGWGLLGRFPQVDAPHSWLKNLRPEEVCLDLLFQGRGGSALTRLEMRGNDPADSCPCPALAPCPEPGTHTPAFVLCVSRPST